MRIEKAMEEDTLVAFRLNGEPIPLLHGAPVRLVVPGWPGSLSQKWLTRILLRATPHDGAGMGGTSYRVPVRPIVPGSRDDGRSFADMESMPVRSVLTSHAHGARLPAGTRALDLSGKAWAGDLSVRAVHVSTDFGATWQAMAVREPANRHAWQVWSGRVSLPSDGYFEVLVPRHGQRRTHAAACRGQLEPAGLRRQPDQPRGGAGGVSAAQRRSSPPRCSCRSPSPPARRKHRKRCPRGRGGTRPSTPASPATARR